MVILGRCRGKKGKDTWEVHFQISFFLICRKTHSFIHLCAQKIYYDTRNRQVNVPIQRTLLEISALPRGAPVIPLWRRNRGSNPGSMYLQSSALPTTLPPKYIRTISLSKQNMLLAYIIQYNVIENIEFNAVIVILKFIIII